MRDLTNDLLHCMSGLVVALLGMGPWYGDLASATAMGLIREVEQMWAADDWDLGPSRLRDIAGYLAGGALAAVLS